jgi:ribosomal protein S18 acetylase RimI-like enzyme
MLEPLSLQKISNDQLADVFHLIRICAEDLKNQGFTHWIDFYADFDAFQEKVRHNNCEVFAIFLDAKLVATGTISTAPPHYFLEPEIKPVDAQGKPLDNFMSFFTPVEPESAVLYLSALCVHPDFQGRGMARFMLTEFEHIARERGLKSIRFDTRAEFEPANRLYRSLGYQVVYIDTFSPNENYYFYEKVLV